MHVTNPLSFFRHNADDPLQKSFLKPSLPGFILNKAAAKEVDACELLHPDKSGSLSVLSSLNTGKLTKLVNYIRNGIPLLVIYTVAAQL